MDPVILPPGGGERVEAAGAVIDLKAGHAATNGAFSMSEVTVAPGYPGPPWHLHRELTDTFYVLEGEIRVLVGEREVAAAAGSLVVVPPGTPHTFSNPGAAAARVLNVSSPAGWEDYLRDLAAAMPPGAPPDTAAFDRLFERYDVEPAGPGAPAPVEGGDLGRAFAEALVRKDWDAVEALLHPAIDFRGMTPGRVWEAATPAEVVTDVLRHWIGDDDVIDEVLRLESTAFADRRHVGYRVRGHNPDGSFVFEDHAHLEERDGRIGWLRVMCSGFRPV